MKGFQIPVIVTRVGHLSGGSDSLLFHTAEPLPDEERMMLIHSMEKTGWLLFREDKFQECDVPESDTDGDAGKSPSKRLRNTLYVLYTQQGGDPKDAVAWENFYRERMEKIINFVKNKLDA